MKLELNWSERKKTRSWCNCVIPAPWLNSVNSTVWEEIHRSRQRLKKLTTSSAMLIHDVWVVATSLMYNCGVGL